MGKSQFFTFLPSRSWTPLSCAVSLGDHWVLCRQDIKSWSGIHVRPRSPRPPIIQETLPLAARPGRQVLSFCFYCAPCLCWARAMPIRWFPWPVLALLRQCHVSRRLWPSDVLASLVLVPSTVREAFIKTSLLWVRKNEFQGNFHLSIEPSF